MKHIFRKCVPTHSTGDIRYIPAVLLFALGVCISTASAATAPVLLYSDLTDAPRTGGENGKGGYVCVYGRNFGATRGSSTITVGGVAVDNYPVWGSGNAVARGDDKVCFQLGISVPTGPQSIQMTVNGAGSNSLPFYVRPDAADAIYCVSDIALPAGGTAPNDSNDGHFGTTAGHGCWATVARAQAVMNSAAYKSTLLYLRNVSVPSPGPFTEAWSTYGGAWGGAPNANQVIAGYPGSTATIGTYTRSALGRGFQLTKSYMTIANITFQAFEFAFRWDTDVPNRTAPMQGWRVVGNSFTCESTAGGSGCVTGNDSRSYAFFGNLFHDVAKTEPHGYMRTSVPTSPYDSDDAVLLSLVSDGATCTVNTQNSVGDIFVGDGQSQMSGIQFMNAPPGIGVGQFIDSTKPVSAVGPNYFKFPCSVASGTYDGTTNPYMYYTGRTKYEHTFYLGSATTDYDLGWNEFANNWTNQDIFAHSTQNLIPNPLNANAKGYWAVPQPLTPSMVQQYGWPTMKTTSGCASGICTTDRTYYVAFSWQGNGGETSGSHETAITVPAGQLLTMTSPPFITNYPGPITMPNFLEGGECGAGNCDPTGWCVYVGTSKDHSKQQACFSSAGTWTEPPTSITTTGQERLGYYTQTAASRGGYTGTHIFVHDNLVHGGASDAMRIDATDPTPSGMWGDDDTAGGVYIYNNVVYSQAKPYYRDGGVNPTNEVGPYYMDNPYGSAVCINIAPVSHNGPTPQGTVYVANNTCYDINAYWPDGVTWAGMIQHNRYFWDPYDNAANNSCQTMIQADNNVFVATSPAAVTPWVSSLTYSQSACQNSLKGQNNVWWSAYAPTRTPPDAAATNADSSCVQGGRNTGTTCFTKNVTADPMFVNPAGGDFRLQAGSPAASGGVASYPTRDYFGVPRGVNGSYSLGAIESGNSAPIPTAGLCDINADGKVDKADVQAAISQVVGLAPCASAMPVSNSSCDVVGVQRVINAVATGVCKTSNSN